MFSFFCFLLLLKSLRKFQDFHTWQLHYITLRFRVELTMRYLYFLITMSELELDVLQLHLGKISIVIVAEKDLVHHPNRKTSPDTYH